MKNSRTTPHISPLRYECHPWAPRKMLILWCMGSKFCVKFRSAPLKFCTKFWTHTSENMHFTDSFLFLVYDVLQLWRHKPQWDTHKSATISWIQIKVSLLILKFEHASRFGTKLYPWRWPCQVHLVVTAFTGVTAANSYYSKHTGATAIFNEPFEIIYTRYVMLVLNPTFTLFALYVYTGTHEMYINLIFFHFSQYLFETI